MNGTICYIIIKIIQIFGNNLSLIENYLKQILQ
jgi:hypothetical protein